MSDAIQRKREERDALMEKEAKLSRGLRPTPEAREELKRVRAALADVVAELANLEGHS